MKFTLVLAFAVSAIAIPTGGGDKPTKPGNPDKPECPGTGGPGSGFKACDDLLYASEQCCATDILGVADLNCANPEKAPTSAKAFQADCAAKGQRARCCTLPILGQAVLCQTPLGVEDK